MMRIQYPNLLTTWCQRSNPTITWFRIMAFLENIWWGPIFGPDQNLDIVTWCICTPFHFWSTRILFEINDHEIEFRFWSTFKLFENPLLVNFEQMKVDHKRISKSSWSRDWQTVPNSAFGLLSFVRSWTKSEIRSHGHLLRREIRVDQKWDGLHLRHVTISFKF